MTRAQNARAYIAACLSWPLFIAGFAIMGLGYAIASALGARQVLP